VILPEENFHHKPRKTPLFFALIMLTLEITLVGILAALHPSFVGRLLAAVGANHVGGRLAFIGVGLENYIPPLLLILIIILYNTTYVLIMYSLFVLFSDRCKHLRWFRGHMKSLVHQAKKRRRFFRQWNRFALFVFVWTPLPWTGAAIGSYIAHLEGFAPREIFATVLPAMWIGVICWTLWFDRLYRFVEGFGKNRTMIITVGLLVIPAAIFLYDLISSRSCSGGDQAEEDK
jgi:uncharacterized membrane protein